MSAKIQSLHIKRFKGISDAPFDVANINVLVGANNSGKSTIIQLLHFGIGVFQAIDLGERWGKQDVVGLSLSLQQLLYAPSADLYALGAGGALSEEKNEAIELAITLTNGQTTNLLVRRGRNGNIRVEVENAQIARALGSAGKPFTIFSPGLAGIAKSETLISNGVLLRTIARGDANLVLRNILYRLHKQGGATWGEFLDDLRRLFSGIEIFLRYNEITDEHIIVEANSGGGFVPIELAGTGILQAIQILGYIHYFHPSAIILDEPDSHLHPNNQRLLCRLLQGVADERDTQVYLTTHSRHVVDALSGQANFLWVRKGEVERVKQDHDLAILMDIGALDAKELIATSHATCVVLTEDTITSPLETLLAANGFPKEGTLVLAYHGCSNPHNLRPLLELIRASNSQAKIVVHRDRDYLTSNEAVDWEAKIKSMNAEPFLTTGTDIESHFLVASHISDVGQIALEEAEQLISEATTSLTSTSVERYVNGRSDIEKKAGSFGKLNIGKLAAEAGDVILSDIARYRHAKSVAKAIRGTYREKFGRNLNLYRATDHLGDPTLAAISKKVPVRR